MKHVEIGAEAVQCPEKEFLNGIDVAVQCPILQIWAPSDLHKKVKLELHKLHARFMLLMWEVCSVDFRPFSLYCM